MKNQAIIVLSGGITKKGKLPFFVKTRLNHAYKCYLEKISKRIIVSGKWSYLYKHTPQKTEASVMKEYLLKLGVAESAILTENKSKDTISSAYFLKTEILAPKRLKRLLIISSDFNKARVLYIFSKVLGDKYHLSYHFTQSHLSRQLLWQVFIYERKVFMQTKAFLNKMRKGNHKFLKNKLFNSPFYQLDRPEQVKNLVAEGLIGKPSAPGRHYSLNRIFVKKNELFAKYKLTPHKFPRGSKPDFWSGKFLNLLGRDEKGSTYALKFVLKEKDRKAILKEIKVMKYLSKHNVFFIPEIVESSLERAPIWYLYKVVAGKIAGRFSLDFSFKPSFYKEFTKKEYVNNLSILRKVAPPTHIELPKWKKRRYKTYFNMYLKTIQKESRISRERLNKAKDYFQKKSKLLNQARLYLAHHDLHPANIIYSPRKRKVFFIDFEHVGRNNLAFDFSFAYLFSWDNKNYRNTLLELFRNSLDEKQKMEFEKVFPIVYIFFLIWFLQFLVRWKWRLDKTRFVKTKKFILKEIERVCNKQD